MDCPTRSTVKNNILVAALIALVASACAPATPAPTPLSVPVTVEVTVRETVQVPVLITPTPALPPQVLRWSVEGVSDLPMLDPPRLTDAPGVFAAGLLFGGLVKLDAELRVAPDAATWTVADDGLRYTFKLRNGLRFSDGTPVTADDVVFSLTRALDPSTGSTTGPAYLSNIVGAEELIAGKIKTLSGVQAVDPHTLLIEIRQPTAFFLNQLTAACGYIVSRRQVHSNPTGWAEQPTGTGPFVLRAWMRGQGLVLTPNPNYYGGPLQITQLDLPFIPDSEMAFTLYRSGDLDVMGNQHNGVPAARLPEVRDLPDLRTASGFVAHYVGFNNAIKPFNDARVRQAFARSVDKSALVKVLGRAARPADRLLPPGFPGSELPIQSLSFNPEAAKKLMTDAGYPAWRGPGPLTLTYAKEGDNERVVNFLQAQWRDNLGVTVNLQPLELAAFSERLAATAQNPEKGVQLYYSVWGADYADPQNFLSQQLRTGAANNNGHFSNAEFDRLVDQADVTRGDYAARLKLYNRAEQIAVTEVGWLPLFNPAINVLARPYVQGLVLTGQGWLAPDWSAARGKSK
jgi:peptide/nickel transport system substrate-binding protein/oligopeptide transport system substrate-binding protein